MHPGTNPQRDRDPVSHTLTLSAPTDTERRARLRGLPRVHRVTGRASCIRRRDRWRARRFQDRSHLADFDAGQLGDRGQLLTALQYARHGRRTLLAVLVTAPLPLW